MTAQWVTGNTLDTLKQLPNNTIDLALTSPPFLALRSYLPEDDPAKQHEIGQEKTPGEFIDTLLDITEELRRVLTPHGSIAIELGDTFSGSGGSGGDYNEDGLRAGQNAFSGSARRSHDGWPADKSLCLIPEIYRFSLVYGFNPLTGRKTPRWRARNVVRWCLDVDTPVYVRTPTGDRPMRLLHLHQQFASGKFQLWDGDRWTPVLGTSTSKADDALEIEFRNGERVSCTREHQWPVDRDGTCKVLRADELTVGDVVRHVSLPEPDVPEDPELLPAEDIGWLVGMWLANGSFDSRDRIQISGHTERHVERAKRCARIVDRFGGTCGIYNYGNEQSVVLRSKPLAEIIRMYVGGDGARNKHLTERVWRRSNEFIRNVLVGYLEGDGHHDDVNNRWRLGFTDNPWLARDLRAACARLGWSCRIKRRPARTQDRERMPGSASHGHVGEIRKCDAAVRKPGEVVSIQASKRHSFIDVGVEGEPHLFALASGLLTHNCRPNPPVGALGDKFRPATSDMVIACGTDEAGRRRYFDLDACREPHARDYEGEVPGGAREFDRNGKHRVGTERTVVANPAGAPPLDWWEIPTHPYPGSHYATFPPDLCVRPIKAMCPQKVCLVCGEPSRRIVSEPEYVQSRDGGLPAVLDKRQGERVQAGVNQFDTAGKGDSSVTRIVETLGWTDCGHNSWRTGRVLDPFGGSGTTGQVAVGHGRDFVGIDLDSRNAGLARDRIGPMFFEECTVDELGDWLVPPLEFGAA